MEEACRILFWRAQTIENSICYRPVPAAASERPCGSSSGRFCDLLKKRVGLDWVGLGRIGSDWVGLGLDWLHRIGLGLD